MKALLAAAVIAGAFPPAAASAQSRGDERINQLIVYGNDPCTRGQGNEIVVCYRRPESDRYRIPPNLRDDPNDPATQAWGRTVQSLEYVGRSGIQSCSPVGAAGWTGCLRQTLREARADRATRDEVNWSQLIDEARQKRLGHIDADAAAEDAAQPPMQLPPPPASPSPQ